MLPDFVTHLRRHLGWQWFGICLISALLCFALIRNSDLDMTALLLGAAAIVWGVSYGALRDQPGYWIYATLAPKYLIDSNTVDQVKTLRFNRWVSFVTPLARPFVAPCILAALIAAGLSVGLWLVPEHPVWVLITGLIVIFPALLYMHMYGSALYFVLLASPEGEQLTHNTGIKLRNVSHYLYEDLLVVLIVTYALIWPLHHQSAFDLHKGYGNPDFIVASLVLSELAAVFMLLGARRSRLYTRVGEQLSAMFCKHSVPATLQVLGVMSSRRRLITYFIAVALWNTLLCWLLSALSVVVAFEIFTLLLLPALAFVYWVERGMTLASDALLAEQYIVEQSVLPASVARGYVVDR